MLSQATGYMANVTKYMTRRPALSPLFRVAIVGQAGIRAATRAGQHEEAAAPVDEALEIAAATLRHIFERVT